MKISKPILIFCILIFLSSCGTIRDGFSNQKKNSTDEFLVEKKSPLAMPPDYEVLTPPDDENDESSLKELIGNNQSDVNETDNERNSENIEQSLLEKIKNN